MIQKKLKIFLFTILLVIMGCSNAQQIQSFSLNEIPSNARSEEPSLLYLVAPEGDENKVVIFTSTISETRVEATPPVTYDLENAEVNDEEVIIEFNDQIHVFERLSKSIVEDTEGVQYQFYSEDSE